VQTTSAEIADGIHRLATYVPEADFSFNQYLVVADEPLLFHTGPRRMFPLVSEAIGRIVPLASLRWITFGHVESDECGAMNDLLAAAPRAQVAHGATAVLVSLDDLADRPPRTLGSGEVLDLGAKRVRWIETPHVPHAWEAGLLFEETTRTLLCGDLFTAMGEHPPTTTGDLVGPAVAAEDLFHAQTVSPATGATIRSLADLEPATLAPMHAPAYAGDTRGALLALADDADARLRAATPGA
jgi:flavorubredoxin